MNGMAIVTLVIRHWYSSMDNRWNQQVAMVFASADAAHEYIRTGNNNRTTQYCDKLEAKQTNLSLDGILAVVPYKEVDISKHAVPKISPIS